MTPFLVVNWTKNWTLISAMLFSRRLELIQQPRGEFIATQLPKNPISRPNSSFLARVFNSYIAIGQITISEHLLNRHLISFLNVLIFNHMVNYTIQALDRTFSPLSDPTRRA